MKFSDILSTWTSASRSAFEARKAMGRAVRRNVPKNLIQPRPAVRDGNRRCEDEVATDDAGCDVLSHCRRRSPGRYNRGLKAQHRCRREKSTPRSINGLTGTIKEMVALDGSLMSAFARPLPDQRAMGRDGVCRHRRDSMSAPTVPGRPALRLSYAISKTATANFGYRYLKTDYDDGGFLRHAQ